MVRILWFVLITTLCCTPKALFLQRFQASFDLCYDHLDLRFYIPSHLRFLKDPPAFSPSFKVVGLALQALDFFYSFVWIIIPTKHSFIARIGEFQVDQGI